VVENMTVADAASIRLEPFDEYTPTTIVPRSRSDAARPGPRDEEHRDTLSRRHQDQDRHLARSGGPQAQDRGRALLGATVAKGRLFGIKLPLTARLIAMIEDLESGRRAMSWANLDELVAAHGGRA